MKNFILTICLLFSFNLSAQDVISYEKVIKADSIGKALLFSTINDWFATTYNSANDVIQMVDKEAGIIIGKGSMKYYYGNNSSHRNNSSYSGNINYTIKVYVKDNRYKVILTDFKHSGLAFDLGLITSAEIYATKGVYKKFHNKAWSDIKLKTEQYSNDIFNSIENKTKNTNGINIGDDW